MRLWHEEMLGKLPKQQLLGQHRECCALRGLGWKKKHSTVQYALNDDFEKLVVYHQRVINEMINRGYNVDNKWRNLNYRGKIIGYDSNISNKKINFYNSRKIVYDYHNKNYYNECVQNLASKGVFL